MSRIDGGNRPSSPKGPKPERSGSERPESSRDAKGPSQQGTRDVQAHGAVRTFHGRSDFEPDRRPTPRATPAPTASEAAAIAGADVELSLLSEFPDQADAQGGLASAMLHAHADEPASQARIVERLKQDGRLESLFGEVFRDGNPYVEQPHRTAVVRALDTALARGTVTSDDLRAFARGAYAQEWRQIGSELAVPKKSRP